MKTLRTLAVGLLFGLAFTLSLNLKLNNLFIIALSLVLLIIVNKKIKFEYFHLSFILYFLLLVFGMIYTKDTVLGWSLVERSISFVILPPLICSFLKEEKGEVSDIVRKTLLSFAVGTAMTTFWYILFDNHVIPFQPEINRVYLGIFLLYSIIILYFYWVDSGERLLLIGLLLLVISLVLVNTKMPIFIGLLFLGSTMVSRMRKGDYKMSMLLLVLIVSVIVVVVTTPTVRERIFYFIQHGDSTRIVNWKAALSLIEDNFWFGVGTGDAIEQLNTKRDVNWFPGLEHYNVHNQYLETWLRIGFVGFLSLLSLFFFQLFFIVDQKQRLKDVVIQLFF